jgi:hypothetical protein
LPDAPDRRLGPLGFHAFEALRFYGFAVFLVGGRAARRPVSSLPAVGTSAPDGAGARTPALTTLLTAFPSLVRRLFVL